MISDLMLPPRICMWITMETLAALAARFLGFSSCLKGSQIYDQAAAKCPQGMLSAKT